jgi:hypothetical protein
VGGREPTRKEIGNGREEVQGEGGGRRARRGWCRIQLPFDVEKTWGAKGACRCRASANGFSLPLVDLSERRRHHHMMFNKAMQEGSGAGRRPVRVEMEPDTRSAASTSPTTSPPLSRSTARPGRASRPLPSNQKGYVDWVTGAKKAETRARAWARRSSAWRRGEVLVMSKATGIASL